MARFGWIFDVVNPGMGAVIVVMHEQAWFLREDEAFHGLVFAFHKKISDYLSGTMHLEPRMDADKRR